MDDSKVCMFLVERNVLHFAIITIGFLAKRKVLSNYVFTGDQIKIYCFL